jgi:hypothetical protein
VRIYKVTTPEGYVIYTEPSEVGVCFDGELCAAAVGDTFELEIMEMTPAEYEALPEFEP